MTDGKLASQAKEIIASKGLECKEQAGEIKESYTYNEFLAFIDQMIKDFEL